MTPISNLVTCFQCTVAVNQLTETVVEPASSVWALLKRDWLDLAWSATNSHFLFGKKRFKAHNVDHEGKLF